MACSDDKGSVTDGTASVGDGEDFPVPPSVVAAAAAAELGFPAPGNKVLLHALSPRPHAPCLWHCTVGRICVWVAHLQPEVIGHICLLP